MFEVIYKYWETSTDTLLDDQSNNKQKDFKFVQA